MLCTLVIGGIPHLSYCQHVYGSHWVILSRPSAKGGEVIERQPLEGGPLSRGRVINLRNDHHSAQNRALPVSKFQVELQSTSSHDLQVSWGHSLFLRSGVDPPTFSFVHFQQVRLYLANLDTNIAVTRPNACRNSATNKRPLSREFDPAGPPL